MTLRKTVRPRKIRYLKTMLKNCKLDTEITEILQGLTISFYHFYISVQKIEVCKKCREFDETQMSQILRQTAKYHWNSKQSFLFFPFYFFPRISPLWKIAIKLEIANFLVVLVFTKYVGKSFKNKLYFISISGPTELVKWKAIKWVCKWQW